VVCDAQVVVILQEYIHVLSRPMAAARARRNVWTNVYLHDMVCEQHCLFVPLHSLNLPLNKL